MRSDWVYHEGNETFVVVVLPYLDVRSDTFSIAISDTTTVVVLPYLEVRSDRLANFQNYQFTMS